MSNKVIGDYDSAGSIDGSTHYLLIQPGNSSTAYKKINRNVLLGLTSDPVGTTATQNITNKTLDNSNILTVRDDRLTLQDNSDNTKQANFQLSGISAGQTRTMTLPNASTTLVGTDATQTLTNKTLTAPVINNGSITGTTITTDAIVGQTDADSGTIYGVSVSNSKIGTGGIADGAITSAKISGINKSLLTTDSNPYKFSVYRNASQNTSALSFAKVVFDAELFDTNNNFASGTYTAPVAGFYQFNARVGTGGIVNGAISIYVNGSDKYRGVEGNLTSGVNNGYNVSTLIQLSANDTVEIYIYSSATVALAVGSTVFATYFNGFLVSRT